MDKQVNVNWQQLAEGFKAERDIIQEQLIQARQEIARITKHRDALREALTEGLTALIYSNAKKQPSK